MLDTTTLSYINLFGVLGAMEDLCRLDPQAHDIAGRQDISVSFMVHGGPRGTLAFAGGACTMHREAADGTIRLLLRSPKAFNHLVEGKGTPIPLRGFTRLGFMTGAFARLSERLEALLRPGEEALADPDFRLAHTEMLLRVAVAAMVEIGNHDPELAQWAASIPEGIIGFEVAGGPALHVVRDATGLRVERGRAEHPRALMRFADMETAHGVISGTLDSFTAIATETLSLSGYIPMLDALDKLLLRAGRYLQ